MFMCVQCHLRILPCSKNINKLWVSPGLPHVLSWTQAGTDAGLGFNLFLWEMVEVWGPRIGEPNVLPEEDRMRQLAENVHMFDPQNWLISMTAPFAWSKLLIGVPGVPA